MSPPVLIQQVCLYALIVSQKFTQYANCSNFNKFFSELNVFPTTLIINHLTQTVHIYHQKLEEKILKIIHCVSKKGSHL